MNEMYIQMIPYFWRAILFWKNIEELLEMNGIKQIGLLAPLSTRFNLVNSDVQNRQQLRLVVLNVSGKIFDEDVIN